SRSHTLVPPMSPATMRIPAAMMPWDRTHHADLLPALAREGAPGARATFPLRAGHILGRVVSRPTPGYDARILPACSMKPHAAVALLASPRICRRAGRACAAAVPVSAREPRPVTHT